MAKFLNTKKALDLFGHTAFTECGRHNKSAVGHKLIVPPDFNIAEANPCSVFGYCYYSFPFFDLLLNVTRRTLGDAGSASQCRGFHLLSDCRGVFFVGRLRYANNNFVVSQLKK